MGFVEGSRRLAAGAVVATLALGGAGCSSGERPSSPSNRPSFSSTSPISEPPFSCPEKDKNRVLLTWFTSSSIALDTLLSHPIEKEENVFWDNLRISLQNAMAKLPAGTSGASLVSKVRFGDNNKTKELATVQAKRLAKITSVQLNIPEVRRAYAYQDPPNHGYSFEVYIDADTNPQSDPRCKL